MRRGLLLLVVLGACKDPAEGTFVGNPTLRARYVDNVDQVGDGGYLETLATAVEPCDAPTVELGPKTFTFVGTEAEIDFDLPEGELCSILIVVKDLAITVDDEGTAKTIIGQDFDLAVPAGSIPDGATQLDLRLGDETWLPSFVPLAPAGETRLNSGSDPDLLDAFYDGLDSGSSFEAINTTVQRAAREE